MRQDLKHWSEAIDLATQMNPSRVPEISRQNAVRLEIEGQYAQVLKLDLVMRAENECFCVKDVLEYVCILTISIL